MLPRWLAAAWLLTLPAAPETAGDLPSVQAPLRPPAQLEVQEPLRFDRSLESLERNRVITPLERRQLETEAIGQPIDVPALQQACRSGALSKQECSAGVAFRGRVRHPENGRVAWRARGGGQPLPPITVPVSALLAGGGGGFRLESVFAVSPRPLPLPGNGDRNLLFPIIGSAITTSEFGMRLHPVIGNWLMHAGKDLAAPEGTPVVAALSGTVTSSGLAGGYGIAVELEHRQPLRRTLYGHLSELYVKAGQTVRQGEVIGRVGSTGLSTGPHLHFELRRPEAGGWVAIDPGELDLRPLTAGGVDAVSLLMAQLMEGLERKRS